MSILKELSYSERCAEVHISFSFASIIYSTLLRIMKIYPTHSYRMPALKELRLWKYEPEPETGLINVSEMGRLFGTSPDFWLSRHDTLFQFLVLAEKYGLLPRSKGVEGISTIKDFQNEFPCLLQYTENPPHTVSTPDLMAHPFMAGIFAFFLSDEFGMEFLMQQTNHVLSTGGFCSFTHSGRFLQLNTNASGF